MRVTCVIDSLTSGGAQRQLCMLARLLKQRGHDVRFVTYYAFDFFKPLLDDVDIPVERVTFHGQWSRVRAVRRAIRRDKPDIVVSYLTIPNLIVEAASLPRRSYRLVVSERNVDTGSGISRWMRLARDLAHWVADAVVANSHEQRTIMQRSAPWLRSRLTTIMNCVDLDVFRPARESERSLDGPVRLVCIGRFERQKNYGALLKAFELVLQERPETSIRFDAYGNNHFIDGKPGPQSGAYLTLLHDLETSPARPMFHVHAPTADTIRVYRGADALCLASLHEGCCNVICEAMAMGKPILASRVGDNPVLVKEGQNGLLFDPHSAEDIARAILQFVALPPEAQRAMGDASRTRAEQLLDPDRFVDEYERLFARVLGQNR